MMSDLELRENSQEPITFTLVRNGSPFDLTDRECILKRRDVHNLQDDFSTLDPNPMLTISNSSSGILIFQPDDDTWRGLESGWKYYVYMLAETSSGSGRFYSFPESETKEIAIYPWA